MRFAVESAFTVTAEVQICTDPWDQGMRFPMHIYGSRRHRQYLKQRLRRDPVALSASAKLLRRLRDLQKPKPAEPQSVGPQVIDVAANGAAPPEAPPEKTFEEVYEECAYEAVEEAIASGELSVLDLFSQLEREKEEVVALLEGPWSGVKDPAGNEVPFTPENVAALLECDAIVTEGQPYAGETVGDALVKHLKGFAKGTAEVRAKYLEAGEKNSEGFSAGA
jgi:hypothetical protein